MKFFIKIFILIIFTYPLKLSSGFIGNINERIETKEWKLIAIDVEATVYNAVPSQCT